MRTPEEIERIRRSGTIAADALELVGERLRPGMSTDDIDALVHEHLVREGAYPSTLGYRGFAKACCTSVNEVVCHGIPDDTVLEEGDLVNVDVTAFREGMHGDTNRTFIVGEAPREIVDLVERTHEAMMRGIRVARAGRQLNVVGRAIEVYARRFGYDTVRDYTGHGVGEAFHTGLIVPHYDTDRFPELIEPGMVFTVEPMLTLGSEENEVWADGWTVVTRDRRPSAQFEHTVAITDDGYDILTLSRSARSSS